MIPKYPSYRRMSEEVTPEAVLSYQAPTERFLCKPSDNIYTVNFLEFRIRDIDSGVELFAVSKPPELGPELNDDIDDSHRFIRYNFGPEFLSYKCIGTTLTFSVGEKPVRNFRMIERHYMDSKLLKSFDFNCDFCIPGSVNTMESIYDMPELNALDRQRLTTVPFVSQSDSFYFVENKLIMHNKAEYSYAS